MRTTTGTVITTDGNRTTATGNCTTAKRGTRNAANRDRNWQEDSTVTTVRNVNYEVTNKGPFSGNTLLRGDLNSGLSGLYIQIVTEPRNSKTNHRTEQKEMNSKKQGHTGRKKHHTIPFSSLLETRATYYRLRRSPPVVIDTLSETRVQKVPRT